MSLIWANYSAKPKADVVVATTWESDALRVQDPRFLTVSVIMTGAGTATVTIEDSPTNSSAGFVPRTVKSVASLAADGSTHVVEFSSSLQASAATTSPQLLNQFVRVKVTNTAGSVTVTQCLIGYLKR